MSENKENIIKIPPCTPDKDGYIFSTKNANGGMTHNIFISEPIYELKPYINLLRVLNTATNKDEIVIKLASPGGAISTGIAICNAIYNSKAKVITQAIGITASIAAVIWCCGKVRSIMPTATLMFHMPSGFGFGKTAEIQEESTIFQEYFKELLKNISKGVLTEEEYNGMVNKKLDVFLSYKTLKARLSRKV